MKNRVNKNYNQVHIDKFNVVRGNYPVINNVCVPLESPKEEFLGRDISKLDKALKNIKKPNVALVGDPGVGKTSYVKGYISTPYAEDYLILAVNIEKLIVDSTGDVNAQMSNSLLELVNEVGRYVRENDVLVVLFIDEFHKIINLSQVATQTLKPILEESADNYFKIIVATTSEEYDKYIHGDKALHERFSPVLVDELQKPHVLHILRSILKLYNLENLSEPDLPEQIYHLSKEIEPSKSQPRASIDILDGMIGDIVKREKIVNGELVREFYKPSDLNLPNNYLLSRQVLNTVIRRRYNIDIDNDISIFDVEDALYSRLLGQEAAITQVLGGLERIIANATPPTKPKFSFISTGSTGVGKTEMAKIICEALKIPMVRFDMSNYSAKGDAGRFRDELASVVKAKPNAYVLLDEIEKSNKEVVNILHGVLDDAILTMSNNINNSASFVGTIINLTTNAGANVFRDFSMFSSGKGRTLDTSNIYNALVADEAFASSVLGRLDVIVPFLPLTDDVMKQIVQSELDLYVKPLETARQKIYMMSDIADFIVQDRLVRDTDSGGARDAKRLARNIVITEISHVICRMTADQKQKNEPLLVYVDGTPKFKNLQVADKDKGFVAVEFCYSVAEMDMLLNQLSMKLGCKLYNKGLLFPKKIKKSDIAKKIVKAVQNNTFSLKSNVINGEFVIESAL